MNIFKRLFNRKTEQRALGWRDPDGWQSLIGGTTAAGVTVTAETAMGHPAVLGAVRMIAELTASLPMITYKRTTGGKVRAKGHPVYELLHTRPNPQQTPFNFKETVCLHLLLHGNAYIVIQWDDNGNPAALWPIHPSRVSVELQSDGTLLYKITTQGQRKDYTADDVLHISMLSLDGLTGKSPVQLARESIAAALAGEEHAASYFANSARPSGILKTNSVLSEQAAKRLKESWQAAYGRGKSHGTAVLEDGTTFESISGNAQEAQLLESRQFAMRAIAAALRIPGHMLDPTVRGAYANVETQSLEFLTFSLQPLLTRLEEAFTLKLFTTEERKTLFVEFLTESLLRTDTRTRYSCYNTAITSGFMTPNEARIRENMEPLAGGDVLYPPQKGANDEKESGKRN
ncbi:Phage portal protein [Sporotomaculum syntrophicum]|uniref:Phage portal protein n=1 Tax=Sporotomaculum syntrophicum TaxID=182264 RepID=A0A9D2WQP1_9FIRM|nr:phage portal protein [Sporotomaculum syntrophicum]KAF1084847.1 Phage portal protein [Sporotomaculum syntrophicum]